MLATHGSVEQAEGDAVGLRGKWDGYRLLVDADHGKLELRSRSGRDVTDEYPQLEALAADLADHHVLLDGEVVALDESGVPSFGEMQNRARATRVEFWAFDILQLDGRSLLRAKYSDRRRLLETLAEGGGLIVPDQLPGDGRRSAGVRAEAAVGRRGRQEAGLHLPAGAAVVVVDQGQDLEHPGSRDRRLARRATAAAPAASARCCSASPRRRPAFAGRVGTGFTEKELATLKDVAQTAADRRITFQH